VNWSGITSSCKDGNVVPVRGIVVVLKCHDARRLVVRVVQPKVELARPAADGRVSGERERTAVMAVVMPHNPICQAIARPNQLHGMPGLTAANFTLSVWQDSGAVAEPLPVSGAASQIRPVTEITEPAAVTALFRR
jgi:hypothetical protein